MKHILSLIIGLSIILGNLFAWIEPNTGWSYVQSTTQTFYIFIGTPTSFEISDEDCNLIEGYGDGSNPQTPNGDCMQDPSVCDVIGAFITQSEVDGDEITEDECLNAGGTYENGECEVCIGWLYYNSYNETQGGSTTIARHKFL